ncbi:hypothetical protein F6R98_07050 [Candidatus Methylospira mobilis]|uniref:Uncharacterized protein n=1 Tax=Candidatus Methylospira mobilis TaxID=1808979 RepID=A0A5Q0BH00_9GAMM|nr:hypothetical protein [Candidatus Methylospira mobilis]QFY42412.1 hypothetical protein F6R98_07050 [Candidatus Methylospira mobilis]
MKKVRRWLAGFILAAGAVLGLGLFGYIAWPGLQQVLSGIELLYSSGAVKNLTLGALRGIFAPA